MLKIFLENACGVGGKIMYRIGIDLGGTNIAVGLVDENMTIVKKKSTPTLAERPGEEIVADIEAELHNTMKNEITTKALGEMVMDRLRGIDEVSYVRFASVYREFKDIDTFLDELKELRAEAFAKKK
jgi:transcriptional regulator NrdR family protein